METKLRILDKVNNSNDLKTLSNEELTTLADEMRELIIKKVNTTGGHFGPNLGIVEMTVAMHRVFNSPVDKFVFDVSHQCYPHKILTGRKEGFTDPDKYLKYTGYTAPEESPHDLFKVGHTSTSVSLATGLAKARDLRGGKENIVAIIGDGSLSGGEAYEGLDNAAVLDSNIIIVVNDNDMSIAVNQGGLYANLKLLRDTQGKAECNFFKAMGFDYRYLDNGHDIEALVALFEEVKDINHPIVLHIHTIKGKGCKIAEENKERFHWIMSGELDKKTGMDDSNVSETYESITADYILNKVKEDKSVVAISPATPAVSGFTQEFREKMGKNYVDVGIAEEHAVAFASGLAKNGAKPILAMMSSFVQRTYDQLSQDLALNNNPATILVNWGGITGADATHLSKYDIPLISNIPNMVYMSPTNKEEYLAILDWSVNQTEYPVAIRVPFQGVTSTGEKDTTDYSIINKYKVTHKGNKVAILGLGNFFRLGKDVQTMLREKLGIDATLINPIYTTGLDKELLEDLKSEHQIVITLEDGVLQGGFGEKIASYYGGSDIKVLNFGADKEFTDRIPLEELYQRYHLTPELIVEDIKNIL